MKKIFFVTWSIFIISIFANWANAALINYNEGLGINPIGPFPDIDTYYSGLPANPVHEGFIFADYSLQGFDPIFGPHSPWGLAVSKYPGGTGIASISWDIGAKNVSFWYGYDERYGPLSVEAYHNQRLVFSSNTLPLNTNGMFQHTIPIKHVIDKIIFYGTPNQYSIDDLEYQPIPRIVPEPSTMILIAVGLVGIAGWGRKRFKKI